MKEGCWGKGDVEGKILQKRKKEIYENAEHIDERFRSHPEELHSS